MPATPTTARGAVITGWGTALPEKIITNIDLESMMDTDHVWIRDRTGISQRHVGGTTAELSAESGRAALSEVLDPSAEHVLDAAQLAIDLRRSRAEHLERLRSEIDSAVPLAYLPYVFARSHGIRTTRQIADRLAEELL